MQKNEQEKFSDLFSNVLTRSGIEYANGHAGEAYTVYDDKGILFTITFYKYENKYVFGRTELLKPEYTKYGLSVEARPNPQMVFETIAFSYKIRQTVIKARKNFSAIYYDTLIDSDIIYQTRGDFETYMVKNSGFPGYAIGYNPKTGQYGFKRYELINTLYKICELSPETKPNYAFLYKRTKDCYMAQVAAENIQHLYDI